MSAPKESVYEAVRRGKRAPSMYTLRGPLCKYVHKRIRQGNWRQEKHSVGWVRGLLGHSFHFLIFSNSVGAGNQTAPPLKCHRNPSSTQRAQSPVECILQSQGSVSRQAPGPGPPASQDGIL